MRHASLFSGIGGFDLAAEWMGWENILSCEYDPFCQKVLQHHFPTTKHHGDIRQLDGKKYRGGVDILTGGFPCQPFSAAGRRRGTEDNRFLWPEMFRIIREIRPRWIVAENVPGILTIDKGMVFERVCSEMESEGYKIQPVIIPACSVNAPHRRDRIWFIAYNGCKRGGEGPSEGIQSPWQESEHEDSNNADSNNDAYTNRARLEGRRGRKQTLGRCGQAFEELWPEAAARLCCMDDGVPRKLDGITLPKWRKESLKAYGNAIVPQVAYQIFKAIEFSEKQNEN